MIDADYQNFSVFDQGGKVETIDRFSFTKMRMFVEFVFSYIPIKEQFYEVQQSTSSEETLNEEDEKSQRKYFCIND